MSGYSLAIDIGTTTTVAAVSGRGKARRHEPRLLDLHGYPWMPSAVYLDPDRGLVAGADAMRLAKIEPARFEPNPKLRIDDGELLLGDTTVPILDVLAALLAGCVEEAARRARGRHPVALVLTHPADWGSLRGHLLRRAGYRFASTVRLVAEPIAAAARMHALGALPPHAPLAVYDLGGGTFDAAVVGERDGQLAILASAGVADLGAEFDQALLQAVLERAGASKLDSRGLAMLREDIRLAKESLSRLAHVDIPMPPPLSDVHLTQVELEAIVTPMLERTVDVLAGTIAEAGVDELPVFLVGGASRMPLCTRLIIERLGIVPVALEQPETAVCLGALGHDPAGLAAEVAAAKRSATRPRARNRSATRPSAHNGSATRSSRRNASATDPSAVPASAEPAPDLARTEPATPGPARTELARTGPTETGLARTGPTTTGSAETEPATSGPTRTELATTEQAKTGSARTGPTTTGSAETGPVEAGSASAGLARTEPARTEPARSELARSGPAGTETPGRAEPPSGSAPRGTGPSASRPSTTGPAGDRPKRAAHRATELAGDQRSRARNRRRVLVSIGTVVVVLVAAGLVLIIRPFGGGSQTEDVSAQQAQQIARDVIPPADRFTGLRPFPRDQPLIKEGFQQNTSSLLCAAGTPPAAAEIDGRLAAARATLTEELGQVRRFAQQLLLDAVYLTGPASEQLDRQVRDGVASCVRGGTGGMTNLRVLLAELDVPPGRSWIGFAGDSDQLSDVPGERVQVTCIVEIVDRLGLRSCAITKQGTVATTLLAVRGLNAMHQRATEFGQGR